MTKHNYNIKLDIPQDADSARYYIPKGYTARLEDGVLIIEPEESEDERIRKWLIDQIKAIYDFESPFVNKVIAWLEKQKEQKLLPGIDDLTPDEKMNHPLYLEGFDVGREVGRVEAEREG